ncbi:MAG: SRPBCC family protein [Nocardioides sp.]|nr:SRPBCC family protein [Nocardioides sp.]
MPTRTVTVKRRLKAPAAALYATLTDPDGFAGVRGVRSVEILKEGAEGPISVGTVRRVDLAAGFLTEEIVALEPGTRFDYLIRDAPISFDHRFGRIEFHDRDGFTEAVWPSTFDFDLPVPVAGAVIAAVGAAGCHAAFAAALGEFDRAARTGAR